MTDEKFKQAWVTCLRLLTATPKTRRQLASTLSERGFEPVLIEKVLRGLEDRGILNDRMLARDVVERLTQAKPSGVRKIRFEMQRKGIPKSAQEEALKDLSSEDERKRARELCRGRWERFAALPLEKRKRRVYDFLIRRGFDFQLVRDAVSEMPGAAGEDS